jgi:hypothetical protein
MNQSQNKFQIDLKPENRIEVLVGLLQTNREEIREWQKALFEASFWFNAGILGITAFVHNLNEKTNLLLLIVGVGISCLSGFYLIFSHVAKKAIELSGIDLLKIQQALRLNEKDYYLNGDSIYPNTNKWLPQNYIIGLRLLNLVISVLAIFSLIKI